MAKYLRVMIFRKKTVFKNRWINGFLSWITVGIVTYFVLKGMLLLLWQEDIRLYSFLALMVIFFYLTLIDSILNKYEIRENELYFIDLFHPFGKKVQIKDIREVKAINAAFSRKKEGLRITTSKEKKYDFFFDKKELFIEELKKRNENIVIK